LQRQYWRFYWPLALTGLLMLLGRQCQNGVLARYEHAARELATWAFAMSVFMPFGAMLVFVPQMVNVLGRSARGRRLCLRFTVTASLILTLPVALAAFWGPGRGFVARIFGLDEQTARTVVLYLRFLTPLVLFRGLRQYYGGLLIQARRTGTVTVLNVFAVAVLIGVLLSGLRLGWSAVRTVALAQVSSGALHLALAGLLYALRYRPPKRAEHEGLAYRDVLAFFWPVALTSLMFALSRPILYAFLNRTRGGVNAVAATRVAFDLSMIFGSAINQFRHFHVTFASRDLAGVRRFMVRAMIAVVALMVLVVFTPLIEVILRAVLRDRAHLIGQSVETLRVLCIWPVAMTLRNYFHGQLLSQRRTGGMAAGGACRVAAVYAGSWLLHAMGWLNHASAAAVLILGFLAEGLTSAWFVRLSPPEPSGQEIRE
jgi:hypothetical protein